MYLGNDSAYFVTEEHPFDLKTRQYSYQPSVDPRRSGDPFNCSARQYADWAPPFYTARVPVHENWQEAYPPYQGSPIYNGNFPIEGPHPTAGYTSNTQHLEPKPALQVAQHESKESFQYGLDHILDLQWNDLEELQLPLNAVLPMAWPNPPAEEFGLPPKIPHPAVSNSSRDSRDYSPSLSVKKPKMKTTPGPRTACLDHDSNSNSNFEELRQRLDFIRVVSGKGEFDVPAWSPGGSKAPDKQYCLTIRRKSSWGTSVLTARERGRKFHQSAQ